MNHWKKTLAGLAIGVALGGTAEAKTLYTAPANADFAGEDLTCLLQNVGTTVQLATIELKNYAGTTIAVYGPHPWQPGAILTVTSTPGDGATYCRFEVMGSGKSIRAHAVYVDPNTWRPTIVVPAR
jgi:hypothetical protein